MAESTWQTYKTAFDSFNRFRYLYGLPLSWPAPLEHIIQFIASLSAEGKASGSIRTYISGLSYMYKIHGLTDITKAFIVTKLLEGAARQNPTHDTRAPITFNILTTLLQALEKVCLNSYEICLFKAAFCLAFFGFLRVGELTSKSLKSQDLRPLQFGDIAIVEANGYKHVKVTIRQSKTDQLGYSSTLFLSETTGQACPVMAVVNYLKVRAQGSGQGQFLVHFDGKPLTRYQFSAILAKSLQFCEGKIGRFKSHSFRIGAATEAAMRGIPDQVIKQWGRWKSESYASYIRF